MKFYKLILLLTLISTPQLGKCQQIKRTKVISTDSIPFVLTEHNNLIIKATLNKKDSLDLMFHTAASSLSIIKDVADSIQSIKWDQEDKVGSWGGENSARYSSKNNLKIGNQTWKNIKLWDCKHSGHHSDGKFGLDLFKNKVVEINFDLNQIVLHDSLPESMQGFDKLNLEYDNGFMFLSAISDDGGNTYINKFLLHSGFAGSILYDDEFIASNKFGEKLEILTEKELKDSFGNIIKVKKAQLPIFKIGSTLFKDIPVGFFEGGKGRQKMSVIGGDVLKRFNIIIDANKEFIYLKSSQLSKLPYSTV